MNRLGDRLTDLFAIVASLSGMGCLLAVVLFVVAAPGVALLALAYAALHWSGAL